MGKKIIFLTDTLGINWNKKIKSFLFIFEFLSDWQSWQSGGPGRAGSGQQWAGPKPGRAKIGPIFLGQNFSSLARPPAQKTGLVGPNNLLKEKKNRASRAGPGHTGPGHIGPSQIWPGFFRANNLMAQPDPNSGWTGLAHRVGPILTPLLTGRIPEDV